MEQTVLVVAVVLLGLILVSLWAVLYQIIKQQGRLLLRMDYVEHSLRQSSHGSLVMGPEVGGGRAQSQGLPIGKPLVPFYLSDLTGRTVGLADFKGKRVLLINWSAECGFCELIASDLAGLQPELSRRNVQMLFVTRGSAESNQKLAEKSDLECPILLLKEGHRALEPFENFGTPVAYMLDEQGRVAEPLAVGAYQVRDLVRKAAGAALPEGKQIPGQRDLSKSRIERDGLKAGTPAPSFCLPDFDGRPVSLEEYRGRRVLLVFSDPRCGPCDQLAPHLVRLHREHRNNNLTIMMVGRGDVEENRRKAQQYGFEFPVVVQRKWELSKQYGIFSTPVAFLINGDGVIARNVARGTNEILDAVG